MLTVLHAIRKTIWQEVSTTVSTISACASSAMPGTSSTAGKSAVPEIDYDELIAACYRITKRPQGTPGCVHFKAGAEWFRSVMLAAAPQPEAAQKGGE